MLLRVKWGHPGVMRLSATGRGGGGLAKAVQAGVT